MTLLYCPLARTSWGPGEKIVLGSCLQVSPWSSSFLLKHYGTVGEGQNLAAPTGGLVTYLPSCLSCRNIVTDQSSLRNKGFIKAHSLRVHSIPAQTRRQNLKTAGHTTSTTRKRSDTNPSVQLTHSFSFSPGPQPTER